MLNVKKCAWNGPGGKELMRKALCYETVWSAALGAICRSLDLELVGDGSGSLGRGAFGRAVKCRRRGSQRVLALKVVLSHEIQNVKDLVSEHSSLRIARRLVTKGSVACCVIRVEETMARPQK